MLQLLQVATMFAADPHPFNINHLEAFYTYHFLVSIYNILNQIHTYIYIYIYIYIFITISSINRMIVFQ